MIAFFHTEKVRNNNIDKYFSYKHARMAETVRGTKEEEEGRGFESGWRHIFFAFLMKCQFFKIHFKPFLRPLARIILIESLKKYSSIDWCIQILKISSHTRICSLVSKIFYSNPNISWYSFNSFRLE